MKVAVRRLPLGQKCHEKKKKGKIHGTKPNVLPFPIVLAAPHIINVALQSKSTVVHISDDRLERERNDTVEGKWKLVWG